MILAPGTRVLIRSEGNFPGVVLAPSDLFRTVVQREPIAAAGGGSFANDNLTVAPCSGPAFMSPDQIDHAIDWWHKSSGTVELHEWLGWTREEYARWAEMRLPLIY